MASHIVIVESPAKAKPINKYLGSDYIVLASYGHIRDLESKDGAVNPEENFAMTWVMSPQGKKRMADIKSALKNGTTLILATDPDREGEAISWHIVQELTKSKALTGKNVERVTFNEITKTAVQTAFKKPRTLDMDLVEAYLARRALDRLVGFTLSPVLWRKLPGAKSAGRVQSVALRLICERESEIEAFNPEEFWNLFVHFEKDSIPFNARVTHVNGEKLQKFTINSQEKALSAKSFVEKGDYTVQSVEKKVVKRNPYTPFTTSTLQQEASRKLRYSPSKTMLIAQKLYEGIPINGEQTGLITYMRTDGITLSNDAIGSIRSMIGSVYGEDFLPKSPRMYKSKIKNAQEAHEAIRPTDIRRTPESLRGKLSDEQYTLYSLIWKRTIACQMESAEFYQTTVDIINADNSSTLRTVGSVLKFEGFLSAYGVEIDEDNAENTDDKRLPDINEQDILKRTQDVETKQSFTTPPPRYTEASIIKTMEELGIGRPSTYTSILKVLQDREYVFLDKRRFSPHDRGRIVTTFLSLYFDKYFNYDFTAQLEEELDNIADGKKQWQKILSDFWTPFSDITTSMMDVNPADIRQGIDNELGKSFFKDEESRQCPKCTDGRLALNFGKFGAYIACGSYPECSYTRQLDANGDSDQPEYPKELGDMDGVAVTLKQGPYGIYVERADTPKPKRSSIPKTVDPNSVNLQKAIQFLSLPREVGVYPDTGGFIYAGLGPFGPYLKLEKDFFSLPAGDDLFEIGLNRAVELVAVGLKKKEQKRPVSLGTHPEDGEDVTIQLGRYGPYAKWNGVNAPLGRNTVLEDVTLEQAISALEIAAKKNGGKKTKSKKSSAKKSTAKKAAAKKSTAKKAAAKKSTTKKSSVKKAAAKKSTTKKSSVKKAAAKKSKAKKSTAKKSTVKKA